MDANGSGSYDAGELIATTEPNGQFTFTEAPSLGATIGILVQGTHLGITYDADLKCTVGGTGNLNITPLTTMLSNGISAESIKYILSTYAGITMGAGDISDDPMYGLALSNTDSIAKIRAAICAYALIQIISAESSGVNGQFDLASIEANPVIINALGYMGDAVRNALSDDMLNNINLALGSAEPTIKATLEVMIPGATSYSVNFPHATANEIAESAFAITKYVMDKAIANSGGGYDPHVSEEAIALLGQNVGIRYWANDNRTQKFISVKFGPVEAFSETINDALISGEIRDGSNVTITTFEVNSTTEAFIVNDYGTIEVVWQ